MKPIKSYSEFLNESKSNQLVNTILDALEPTIVDMINKIETAFLKANSDANYPKVFSEYDRELTRLTIIFDMLKSIESYTTPTDQLISLNSSTSRKGNLEITAQIQRDDTVYNLSTEVIIAGGYNIQIAHYRYLTSTNLPKTGSSAITKEYSDKIKKMSKAEKLQKEIQFNQTRIENNQKLVDVNSTMSDSEIIKIVSADGYGTTPTGWFAAQLKPLKWDELSDEQKKRFGSKSEMEKNNKEQTEGAIAGWKRRNIQWPNDYIKTANENIVKLQKKLDIIIQSN